MNIEEIWQGLLDKDDRTSPEEYPEMVLITRLELEQLLVEEREDAALLAFASVTNMLTAASRLRCNLVGDALLGVAEAIGNIGRNCARMLALGKTVGQA